MKRKNILVNNEVYHIYNRSIANYTIFNTEADFQRFLQLLKFFQLTKQPTKFSRFLELEAVNREGFFNYLDSFTKNEQEIVQIIAYSLMPTHIHLILKQLKENGISMFMSDILNSYTRYFNTKHHRKGPLWESKFQNVFVTKDEILLHLTRYLHLNPVTANFVNLPQDWEFSSYKEYLSGEEKICCYKNVLDFTPKKYQQFVDERISYQKLLAKIKNITID